jgi:hypothetical protein
MRVVATHIVLKNYTRLPGRNNITFITKVYELSNNTYVFENENGSLEQLNNDEFHELEENYERYCKS